MEKGGEGHFNGFMVGAKKKKKKPHQGGLRAIIKTLRK